MVRALFLAGHDTVIVDACNNTRKRRDEWRSEEWDTVFKLFDTSERVCRERAESESDKYILPVIERMFRDHEPLQDDEQRWP